MSDIEIVKDASEYYFTAKNNQDYFEDSMRVLNKSFMKRLEACEIPEEVAVIYDEYKRLLEGENTELINTELAQEFVNDIYYKKSMLIHKLQNK